MNCDRQYNIVAPARHALHECTNAAGFCTSFAKFTGRSILDIVHDTVRDDVAKSIYLTGSIPLGMATHGSDADLIVLIDGKDSLLGAESSRLTNTDKHLAFHNESDPLRAGLYLTVMNGLTVEVSVVMTPTIRQIAHRLRSKGPDMNELEIMTLGRLGNGWLLWQSEKHLQNAGISIPDPALDIYCSTRHFTYSLIYRLKATRALERMDIPQALHLGRMSVESAYLAYFAGEGMSYLGAKWLAQIGHAHGAEARIKRHPLLQAAIPLLFPVHTTDAAVADDYLRNVAELLHEFRALIEEKTLFRIAYRACPQIYPI